MTINWLYRCRWPDKFVDRMLRMNNDSETIHYHTRTCIFTVRLHAMQRKILLLQFCPSVRPSVRLSVRRVYCLKTKWCTANILKPHETAITLVFWHQHWLMIDAPFPLKSALKVTHSLRKSRLRRISAHNVSTAGDSENSPITANIKSTTGIPTSYRWSAYVTPKSRKVGSKSDFFVF